MNTALVPADISNVRSTRALWPAPKFWPAIGAAANDTASIGRNSDCISREPMPNPACACAPKRRMQT